MERKIGKRKVEVHKMEGLYPYVRLEDFMKVCKGLEKENENLKEKISEITMVADDEKQSIEHILELEEENRQQKLHIEAKDKAYMSLLTDYNYLEARIKKMQKAYLNFHDDLKKLDDKLDNVIMNR